MDKDKVLKSWEYENNFLENKIKKDNLHTLVDSGEVIPYFQTIHYYTDRSSEVKEIRICVNNYGTKLQVARVFNYTDEISRIRHIEFLDPDGDKPTVNGVVYTIIQNNYIEISAGIRIDKITYRDSVEHVSYNGAIYNLEHTYGFTQITVQDGSLFEGERNGDIKEAISLNNVPSSLSHSEVVEKFKDTVVAKFIPQMSSIVTTMKLEQDDVMRLPEHQISFIYGPPGSGKTNIALHRVSYLINEVYKDKTPRIGMFVFQPVLKGYLLKLVNELKLSDIVELNSIDKWIIDEVTRILKSVGIYLNGVELYKKPVPNLPSNSLQLIRNHIKNLNKDQKTRLYNVFSSTDSKTVKSHTDNLIKFIEQNEVYISREFSDILYSISKGNFTKFESGFDYMNDLERIRLSTNNSVDIETIKKSIKYYQEKSNTYKLNALIDLFNQARDWINVMAIESRDDITMLDYDLLLYVYSCEHVDRSFDHIFVDEAQDFSLVRLAILANYSKNAMTLTGDKAQAIFQEQNVDTDNSNPLNIVYQKLETSHRVTYQIIRFANLFIKQVHLNNNKNLKVTRISESLPTVLLSRQKDCIIPKIFDYLVSVKNQKTIVLSQWNKDKYPDGNLTTLGKIQLMLRKSGFVFININRSTENLATALTESSLFFGTYQQVKGLEFDNVVILDFEENCYSKTAQSIEIKQNLLYTVITRAKLHVILCLPISSKIYNAYLTNNRSLFEVVTI